MTWIETLFNQSEVTHANIVLRLLVSLLLGGAIGWERESKRQTAGLRTHVMICMGATLFMITSIYIPQTFRGFPNGDPGRLAAQVVSGVGFLGAGAIFRIGSNVKGLTTAATIWVVAAIGLAVGAGEYIGALTGTSFILFVLTGLGKVERKFFREYSTNMLLVQFQTGKLETDALFTTLKRHKIRTKSTSIQQSKSKKSTRIKLMIQIPRGLNYKQFYHDLNELPDVAQITLGHDF